MKSRKIESLSNDELLQRIVDLGIQRHEAASDLDTKTYNKLVDKTWAAFSVLKSRSEDNRRLLLPLMDHENPGVRFAAASLCLTIEPARARAVLEAFDDEEERQERLLASSFLYLFDKGMWTPP